jgi:hypothetical protein
MGPAQVGLAIQPTQKVRYVAQITGIVASSQYGEPARELRCGPFSVCGRSSGPNSSARHSFYWLVLAAFPAVGERLLEREDFGYSAWAFLLSPRDGSRKQSPPTPADDAWHCSMLSKPQLVICPVTSLRQILRRLPQARSLRQKRSSRVVVPQRARLLLSKALSSCLFSLVTPEPR